MQVKLIGGGGLLSPATGVPCASVKLVHNKKKKGRNITCMTVYAMVGTRQLLLKHKERVLNVVSVRGYGIGDSLAALVCQERGNSHRIFFQKTSSTSTTNPILHPTFNHLKIITTSPRTHYSIKKPLAHFSPRIHYSCMRIKS
jgi:hypothetical protein